MLYFAYGSNMSQKRIESRLPEVQFKGVAKLAGFQLRFHKQGRDGSAKADVVFTNHEDDCVYGALFELSEQDVATLDVIEDCGVGYERKSVNVECVGQTVSAWIYCALKVDSSLLPFSWYKLHVLKGAEALKLPAKYITLIHDFPACVDSDGERHRKEVSVYSE